MPDSESKLRKSKEHARSLLTERIAEGKTLISGLKHFNREADLEGKIETWNTKNQKLLERLFTTPTEYLHYVNTDVSPMDESMEAVSGVKLLRLQLQYLEGLRESLDYYDESEPPPLRPQRFAFLDSLHPKLVQRCKGRYEAGHYDDAILNAVKCVETAIRDKIGAGPGEYGSTLVDKALNPKNHLIQVTEDVQSEKEGAYFLYRGAMAVLKNPQSHRFLDTTDPVEALEIIAFASFLLRRLEAAKLRKPDEESSVEAAKPRKSVAEKPNDKKAKGSASLANLYQDGRVLRDQLDKRATAPESTQEERKAVSEWCGKVREALQLHVSTSRATWVLSAPFAGQPHGHYGEMTLRPYHMTLFLDACLKRLDDVLKGI